MPRAQAPGSSGVCFLGLNPASPCPLPATRPWAGGLAPLSCWFLAGDVSVLVPPSPDGFRVKESSVKAVITHVPISGRH